MENLPILEKGIVKLAQPILTKEIAEDYERWLKEEEVKRGIGGQERYARGEVGEFLREWRKDPLKMHWFVFLKDNGREIPAGDVNLDVITKKNERIFREFSYVLGFDSSRKKAEVAIMLSEKFHGMGIGTSATRLLVDYAFNELSIELLVASIYAGNTGSLKLFKKCGFEEEYCFLKREDEEREIIMSLGGKS